jgi:predicted metalloprotease with PDZ domain
MPILFSRPDTTTVRVGETEVLVAVSSSSGKATSEFIAKQFSDVLHAERAYMGGQLPVNKYAFLLHFLTPGQPSIGTGALEHNYSSLYVLPDYPQEYFIQPLKDIAAHEFFHIMAPLNVHSEEIRYFDFNDPEMSRHLWLYEGVTEYFSHHAQLVHGITDMEYFLNQMQEKANDALNNYDDALPFTELSTECLTIHHAQYGNVYQKGALIGLCLDVLLREESNGEMGLMDLMLALKEKFGADKPFKDEQLFREIGKLSYPEARKFLKKHVSGKHTLPLKETFAAIGVEFTPPYMTKQFTFGNISLAYNAEANRLVVSDIDYINDFGKKMGYHKGDEIISINGKTFDDNNPMALLQSEQQNFVEGELLTVELMRKDKTGVERKVILSAPLEKVDVPGTPSLKRMTKTSADQQQVLKQWQQGAKALPLRS